MSVKPFAAGKLRQRIGIYRADLLQDPDTGEMETTWIGVAIGVPASVEPLSGREFIAAASPKSTTAARIVIRYMANLNAAMRIRHNATTYNIKAILPDSNSGNEWLTFLVESE